MMLFFSGDYQSVWLEVTYAWDEYKYIWSADLCLGHAIACEVVKLTTRRRKVPDTQRCPPHSDSPSAAVLQEILWEALA